MDEKNLKKQKGVYMAEGASPDPYFENLYLAVRKKEKRIYTNEQLFRLPDIDDTHVHHKEWLVRKSSCKKLLTYLEKKNRPLNILEVGCGNGWLSNKLAEIPNTDVIGVDINLAELQQAATVFSKDNLHFIHGDPGMNILKPMQFDIIIFAASLPYFSSVGDTIAAALLHLTASGEIHIIDSFFYNKQNIKTVRQKCKTYYEDMDIPEMANHYFHHTLNDLSGFNYRMIRQNFFLQKLFFNKAVFPWLCIRHS